MQATLRTAATVGCLATCVLVTLGLGGRAAAADGEDVLELTVLTGPAGGDLTITLPASAGGAEVGTFEHVQIRLIAPTESDREAEPDHQPEGRRCSPRQCHSRPRAARARHCGRRAAACPRAEAAEDPNPAW